jgi:hypothetical protein
MGGPPSGGGDTVRTSGGRGKFPQVEGKAVFPDGGLWEAGRPTGKVSDRVRRGLGGQGVWSGGQMGVKRIFVVRIDVVSG